MLRVCFLLHKVEALNPTLLTVSASGFRLAWRTAWSRRTGFKLKKPTLEFLTLRESGCPLSALQEVVSCL